MIGEVAQPVSIRQLQHLLAAFADSHRRSQISNGVTLYAHELWHRDSSNSEGSMTSPTGRGVYHRMRVPTAGLCRTIKHLTLLHGKIVICPLTNYEERNHEDTSSLTFSTPWPGSGSSSRNVRGCCILYNACLDNARWAPGPNWSGSGRTSLSLEGQSRPAPPSRPRARSPLSWQETLILLVMGSWPVWGGQAAEGVTTLQQVGGCRGSFGVIVIECCEKNGRLVHSAWRLSFAPENVSKKLFEK